MTASLLPPPFICFSTPSYYYSIFFSFSEQIRVGLYSNDVFWFLFYFCFTLSGNREIKSTRIDADADADSDAVDYDNDKDTGAIFLENMWICCETYDDA